MVLGVVKLYTYSIVHVVPYHSIESDNREGGGGCVYVRMVMSQTMFRSVTTLMPKKIATVLIHNYNNNYSKL